MSIWARFTRKPKQATHNDTMHPVASFKSELDNLINNRRIGSVSSSQATALYHSSATIYAAANYWANNVAQVPFVVKFAGEVVDYDHPLKRLISNKLQFAKLQRRTEMSHMFYGYNATLKVKNGYGNVFDLVWLNPTLYYRNTDPVRGFKGVIVHMQDYKLPDDISNRPKAADLIYTHLFDFADDFDGVAPAEVAFLYAGVEAELAHTAFSTFQNMAIPAGFVQPSSDNTKLVTVQDRDNLVQTLQRIARGGINAGRTIVSQTRWDWQTLQPPFKDLEVSALSDSTTEKILHTFDLPMELIKPSVSNYSQAKEARIGWIKNSLVPRVMRLAEEYTAQLAQEFGDGYTIEPNFDNSPFIDEIRSGLFESVKLKLTDGMITYANAQRELGQEVTPEYEDMVYVPAVNAPVPTKAIPYLWKSLLANGAGIPENVDVLADDTQSVYVPDEQYSELKNWKIITGKKSRAYDFEVEYLPQHVVDYLQEALKGDESLDSVFSEADRLLRTKAIQATRIGFEDALESILMEAQKRTINRRRFRVLLDGLISRYGRLAYRDGLIDGGILDGNADENDKRAIASLIAEQSKFITNLGDVIFNKDKLTDADIRQKPSQWYKKSILPFYNAGLVSANANQMMEFAGDDGQESCWTCTKCKGQRHRLRVWMDRRLVPQQHTENFVCGGHNCKHRLVRVVGRAHGRLPSVGALEKALSRKKADLTIEEAAELGQIANDMWNGKQAI